MGLDTSHGCWHGAYSAFMRFREELARAARYPFGEVHEFCNHDIGSCNTRVTYLLPWDGYPDRVLDGDWTGLRPVSFLNVEDPLLVLLMHSDCDGSIPSDWCLPLAERIEQLADEMPAEGVGHLHSPAAQAWQFANGLRDAHEAGEDVEFH